MKALLVILILISVVWKSLVGFDWPVSLGPGIHAPDVPAQQAIADQQPFRFEEYRITPLADFSLRAKVLGKEKYFLDKGAGLSPVDLVLGWQQMSDEDVLERIDISQSNRWYYWRTREYPIPRRKIETSSANMHMIPATDAVADELKSVRTGAVVELEGKLVRVKADDGWTWKSSLTRDDTGANACELIWVENFRIVEM